MIFWVLFDYSTCPLLQGENEFINKLSQYCCCYYYYYLYLFYLWLNASLKVFRYFVLFGKIFFITLFRRKHLCYLQKKKICHKKLPTFHTHYYYIWMNALLPDMLPSSIFCILLLVQVINQYFPCDIQQTISHWPPSIILCGNIWY
jgi:hypothetical protein